MCNPAFKNSSSKIRSVCDKQVSKLLLCTEKPQRLSNSTVNPRCRQKTTHLPNEFIRIECIRDLLLHKWITFHVFVYLAIVRSLLFSEVLNFVLLNTRLLGQPREIP